MSPLLFIPWFKAEAIRIPLPFSVPLIGDSLPIQPFGVLVAIGVLLGVRLAEEYARRAKIQPAYATDFATYTVGFGFVGAIVLNVVFYYPERLLNFFSNPLGAWTGLSSYGGFIGAAVGIYLWKLRYKLPVLAIADTAAFGFPFGWIFGRLGCFVVHDHPGRVTDFFLAVDEYRVGTPPYLPRHDLGLYEVIWSVAVSALFLWLWRKPRPGGYYLSLLILLYAPIRFFLDFLRAESEEGGDVRYFGLTPGQYASVAFLVLGAWLLRKVVNEPPAPIPEEAKLVDGESGPAKKPTEKRA